MENYPDKLDQQLVKAIASLKSEKEIQNFLRDILTLAEIKEASKRLQIAKLLWTTDMSYAEIAGDVKTSTTTVTRVNDWLRNKGLDGYQVVLKNLFPGEEKKK
jgi:TrpR-related protein YerC/YecD